MAVNPNPGPLLLPIVSDCFTKAAGPVRAALLAAGHLKEEGSLAYTAGLVERMSSREEFDATRVRRVLDVAGQLPALHGSQDLADLYDLVRTIEALDRLPGQPWAACLVRARQQQEAAWHSSGPNDRPHRSDPPA